MPDGAIGILLAASSWLWHPECTASPTGCTLQLRLVYRILVYGRIQAVGVTDCCINDTDASLRILRIQSMRMPGLRRILDVDRIKMEDIIDVK